MKSNRDQKKAWPYLLPLGIAGLALGNLLPLALGDRKTISLVSSMMVVVGGALLVSGCASFLLGQAIHRRYECLVSWRYLCSRRPSRAACVVGVALLSISAVLALSASADAGGPDLGYADTSRWIEIAYLGLFRLGSWVLYFGVLMLFFSVYTAIAIFGTHLGISSLIVILGIMAGFSEDTQQKIVANRPHVVISKPDMIFDDYNAVLEIASKEDGVTDVRAVIESEVILSAHTNMTGALLRGVDQAIMSRMIAQSEASSQRDAKTRTDESEFSEIVAIPSSPDGDPGSREEAGPNIVGLSPSAAPADEKPGRTPLHQKGQGRDHLRPGFESSQGDEDAAQPSSLARSAHMAGDLAEIVVGSHLAKSLQLRLGDVITLIAPMGAMSPMGPIPKSRFYRVRGSLSTGLYEQDSRYVYSSHAEARSLLALGDEVSAVEMRIGQPAGADQVRSSVAKKLPSQFEVKDWRQLNRNLFSALRLEKIVMFVVLAFVALVASFAIAINLIMMIFEKRTEIGMLKAVGSTDASVLSIFVIAGAYVGAIGMMSGAIEGIAICTFLKEAGLPLDPELYYTSLLPVSVDAKDVGGVIAAGTALSAAATIYPALRAARMRPIDSLRR